MNAPPRRILLVAFGTRGDVQPFCILGRALAARGHAVRLATTRDYHPIAQRYGLDLVETGEGFEAVLRDPEFEGLFRNYLSAGLGMVPRLRRLARRLQDQVTALMLATHDAVAEADIVVHNPFAFFAGAYAREQGRPVVRVLCQPLLPSRRTPLSLFGGRSLGRYGNRLSYETFRLIAPGLRRSLAEVRRRRDGAGRGLGLLVNPLTEGLAEAHHVLAFSPALSPPQDDWPVPALLTGAWFDPPAPDAVLPAPVAAFLAAGPPPVHIGFGSMFWGGRRNTAVVMQALAQWGGRAILSRGPGGLAPPEALPPTMLAIRGVDHGLLFPHVAATVHHGGAGTTAATLRAGRPSVVLPLLGDQLYWGRRVAAVGAAEAPLPLGRITPEALAGRIARACTDPGLAAAAAGMARTLAAEPGVAAAADLIDALARGKPAR